MEKKIIVLNILSRSSIIFKPTSKSSYQILIYIEVAFKSKINYTEKIVTKKYIYKKKLKKVLSEST